MVDEIQKTVTEFSYLFQRYESAYLDISKRLKIPQISLYILQVLREFRYDDENFIITQSDLSKHLSVSKQTIHSALLWLKKNGLVKLENIEGNKKSKNIVTTKKGKDFITYSVDRLNEAKIRAFEKMNSENRKLLLDLLKEYGEEYLIEVDKLQLGKETSET